MRMRRRLVVCAVAVLGAGTLFSASSGAGGVSGAIYTTTKDGTAVNANVYGSTTDVYLSGGPQNANAKGLPDGTYYFQVTDPSGKTLLSTDDAVCRQLTVTGGRITGSTGPACKHANGTLNPANGGLPVQLAPFSQTPNAGNEYKVWLIPVAAATISSTDSRVLVFSKNNSKTDNFKAIQAAVQQGSCQPSSSVSALVSGTNVVSYVPKGSWDDLTTGVAAVNVEGSSITDTLIPTTSAVNSCASNPTTGKTVCTGNNSDVYVLDGTGLDGSVSPNPLTSAGTGLLSFSGGDCTNCGVAMDATNNRAVIGLSVAGAGGFQFLNLGTMAFEPPFLSQAPAGFEPSISEDPLIDPIRNLLLSANENNNYEIVDVTNSTTPQFFENPIPNPNGSQADSSGEDCSTGIVLAPYEFSDPSDVFIADINNPGTAPNAVFTPGSPGTWTAPSQIQTLTGSSLSAGASGVAVAQGTHTGIISGEFDGDAITAISLPTTSGTGAVPAIGNWMTCNVGNDFEMGTDPHSLTAYQSPNGGAAIALLANDGFGAGANTLARVDLTAMLALPESAPGSHVCASGTLPASVVSFIALP
jgi:hypothetical protein